MSSILEALKKAERESTADRGTGTPWPAPLPAPSPDRQRARRWWLPLVILVGLCVSGVVLWKMQQANIFHFTASMDAKSPPPPHKTSQTVPPSARETRQPRVTVAESPPPPAKTLTDASPRPGTQQAPVSAIQSSVPTAMTPPVQAVEQPQATARPASNPAPDPDADSNRRTKETVKPTGQSMAEALDSDKAFRSDPRIDLQALVWAPESAARFVVINNRLVKEGGLVDNILVVQINPDDVLLAEGSDRWYEVFKVR